MLHFLRGLIRSVLAAHEESRSPSAADSSGVLQVERWRQEISVELNERDERRIKQKDRDKAEAEAFYAQVEREKKYPPLVASFHVGGELLPQYGPLFRLEYPVLSDEEMRASRREFARKMAEKRERQQWIAHNMEYLCRLPNVVTVYSGEHETVFAVKHEGLPDEAREAVHALNAKFLR